MTELRWPDGRGQFRDRDPDRIADDVDMRVVGPGTTIDIDDQNTVDHYLDRGFQLVTDADDPQDPSQSADSNIESPDSSPKPPDADDDDGDGDEIDVDAFVDRTPVATVVDDIEAGVADGHLDAVVDADDRITVERAVDKRKEQVQTQDDGGGG